MPMHDYDCEKCGHEEKDLISTGSLTLPCPKCGNILTRHFPRTGHFKLKGEGWSKDGHALNKDEDVVKHD